KTRRERNREIPTWNTKTRRHEAYSFGVGSSRFRSLRVLSASFGTVSYGGDSDPAAQRGAAAGGGGGGGGGAGRTGAVRARAADRRTVRRGRRRVLGRAGRPGRAAGRAAAAA